MGNQASMLLTDAVPWSSVQELVDWTCHAGVTEAVRGPDAATVLLTPAPTSALTLCPGFPYIRSTKGSSGREDGVHARPDPGLAFP